MTILELKELIEIAIEDGVNPDLPVVLSTSDAKDKEGNKKLSSILYTDTEVSLFFKSVSVEKKVSFAEMAELSEIADWENKLYKAEGGYRIYMAILVPIALVSAYIFITSLIHSKPFLSIFFLLFSVLAIWGCKTQITKVRSYVAGLNKSYEEKYCDKS